MIRVIKGDTSSLDYSSYGCRMLPCKPDAGILEAVNRKPLLPRIGKLHSAQFCKPFAGLAIHECYPMTRDGPHTYLSPACLRLREDVWRDYISKHLFGQLGFGKSRSTTDASSF